MSYICFQKLINTKKQNMKILINPKIEICKPVKNKNYGYTMNVDKDNPNQLTIKSRSISGRNRGIAGVVDVNGDIHINESHNKKLKPLLTSDIRKKILIVLDLVFDKERDKVCSIDKKGLIEFKK